MARINIILPDTVEHRLRVAVAQEGGKKGDLSATITEAVKQWLDDRSKRSEVKT